MPFTFTETEKAYIAGIVDGEGTVSIGQEANGNFMVSLSISNTFKPLIDWLSGKLNHKVYILDKAHSRNEKWKILYTVVLSSHTAKELLEVVFPYLIVKREHALVVLGFPLINKNERRLTEEEKLTRAICCVRMKALNRLGKEGGGENSPL